MKTEDIITSFMIVLIVVAYTFCVSEIAYHRGFMRCIREVEVVIGVPQ